MLIALVLSAAPWLAPFAVESPPLAEVRALQKEERFEEAYTRLYEWLRRNAGTPEAHALHAETLLDLERADEAAHQLELALWILTERGAGLGREAKDLERKLSRTDTLARKRATLWKRMAKALGDIAERLLEEGHAERALELLERIAPASPAGARVELDELLERARAAFAEVDLDDAGEGAAAAEERELVEVESKRYMLACNLEPEVAQLVGEVMDDVFAYYVLLYFDGDTKRAAKRKATIRIHATHARMMELWSQPSRSVGGWWSPGEWTVHCYDTRGDTGTLDQMLQTLFHEASHQFVTMLEKGGNAPAWINEGTASFFEGATAMADHRVLWPDAASSRLANLARMLESKTGPTVHDVVAYDLPSSYPGDHYPFGWGLVYFLQQYEDPETLAYVWRPYYQRCLEEATSRGGPSLQMFEEIVLAKGNPGGFEEFDDFAEVWERWILDVVRPLHFGADRRERRLARLARYVAAADAAAGDRKAAVDEEELLLRALRDAEYVRTRIDLVDEPDGTLVLQVADLLERLDRDGTAAAMIELALEISEAGRLALDDEQQDALVARMDRLDRRNAPLRALKTKRRGFLKQARAICAEYERGDDPMILRAYTFAKELGQVLEDDEGLLVDAARLRSAAIAAGRIASRVVQVESGRWIDIPTREPKRFEHGAGTALIEEVAWVGRLGVELELRDEYELRGVLEREGEVFRSSFHGLVVAGSETGDCWVIGVNGRGRLSLMQVKRSAHRGATLKLIAHETLDPAPPANEPLSIAAHLHADGRLVVRVGEGADAHEAAFSIPDPPIGVRHVGVLVKDGRLRARDLVVEIFP